MNTRTLTFILLSSVVLMVASILQGIYQPAKPKQKADNTVVQEADTPTDSDTAPADGSADSNSQTTSKSDVLSPDVSDAATGNLDSNEVSSSSDEKPSDTSETELTQSTEQSGNAEVGNEDKPAPDQPADQDAEGNPSTESNTEAKSNTQEALEELESRLIGKQPPSNLLSIGSLEPTSGFRFLVTFDPVGGAIRRVELNARLPNGSYKYRDLEHEGGYLGELECRDMPAGCVVGIAGPGTPAAVAGIKAGDTIASIAGTPIVSRREFLDEMAKTHAGDSIAIEVRRSSGEKQSLTVELTDKPMEIMRPEPDTVDPEFVPPGSFLTTLRLRTDDNNNWPEIDADMRLRAWEVTEQSESEIQFTFTLPSERLEEHKLSGPVQVHKRFSLEKLTAEAFADNASRNFHIDFDFEINSPPAQKQRIGYQLDGPIGTPSEGWWYQNKIHGRQMAIGYIAGSRDVISSSPGNKFNFWGGPEIVKNRTKSAAARQKLYLFSPFETPEHQKVNYVSVDTQYFNVSLIPTGEEPYEVFSAFAMTTGSKIPKEARLQKLVDCTFKMFGSLAAGETEFKQSFEIFGGPKEPELLEAYGLGDARTFGWFAWFSKPLCWLLHVFYTLTFQLGYGIPIILLTVLVRSIMIPVSRKAALNAQMMQYLQPQIKEIADKYKDDMEKRAAAQRALFKKYDYNPFGGCFMMFFQLPIFIGLYRGLSVDIALRDQPLIPGLSWCSNLSAPDQFLYWKDWMPTFLAGETGWLGPYLNILPIITIFLFLAQQKLFTPPATDEQQEMAQKVMKFMMIFMGFLFFKVPSGLCLYFITSSIWGIAERKMLPKPKLDTDSLDGLDLGDGKKKGMPLPGENGSAKVYDNTEMLNERKRIAKERKKAAQKAWPVRLEASASRRFYVVGESIVSSFR